MAAGDAEVERLEAEHRVAQLERRGHVVERQIRRQEPLALETHFRIDDAKLVDIVGTRRQRAFGQLAFCRLLVLRRGSRARRLVCRRQVREPAQILVIEARRNEIGVGKRFRLLLTSSVEASGKIAVSDFAREFAECPHLADVLQAGRSADRAASTETAPGLSDRAATGRAPASSSDPSTLSSRWGPLSRRNGHACRPLASARSHDKAVRHLRARAATRRRRRR